MAWCEPRRPVALKVAAFALGSLPPILLTVAYNWHHFRSWIGGYHMATAIFNRLSVVSEGAPGLLLSPNRGLLVYSPVCLVGLLGSACVWRRWRRQPALAALLGAGVLYFLVHAATFTWAGGWCFGPRYTTELMPLLALAAPAGFDALGRAGRLLLIPAAIWSALIQISGAFFFPASGWHARMQPAFVTYREIESHAWDWQHFMPWEDYQAWRSRP